MKKENKSNDVEKMETHGVKGILLKHLEFIVALLAVAAWFTTIFGIAVGLGWLLHVAEAQATWMSPWMFQVGHVVEKLLFLVDILGLVVGTLKELWNHVLKDVVEWLKNLRK